MGTAEGASRLFWTKEARFEGVKVFPRNDIFDPNQITSWREGGKVITGTNLERMVTGRAPMGVDGKSVNLHHMLQSDNGPLAEMTKTFHQQNSKVVHINPSTIQSGINRSAFDAWRARYCSYLWVTVTMNANPREEAQRLIAANPSVVDFGSPADAVGDEWIAKAEVALSRPLPESYKWFLKTYAGGEIGGEEIYSLYGMPFESVNGGDVVFQHLANRKAGLLDDLKLAISETDFGEVFFFDYSKLEQGECPVYLRLPSGETVPYAENFYEFLCKRIAAHCS